jgi:hypothetical protein
MKRLRAHQTSALAFPRVESREPTCIVYTRLQQLAFDFLTIVLHWIEMLFTAIDTTRYYDVEYVFWYQVTIFITQNDTILLRSTQALQNSLAGHRLKIPSSVIQKVVGSLYLSVSHIELPVNASLPDDPCQFKASKSQDPFTKNHIPHIMADVFQVRYEN